MLQKWHTDKQQVPIGELSNNNKIPLLGLEVGHMVASEVEAVVTEGYTLGDEVRLLDTSHFAGNENEVAMGIVAGARIAKELNDIKDPLEIHVVTKVWYTHLGYERTRLSVRESLKALDVARRDPNVNLKIHLMLHWPRCYDGVEWMHCEEEENDLPDYVKNAGPAPHLDRRNAWKESWRALEDIYSSKEAYPNIASIGVANFKNGDVEALMRDSRIKPHLVQLNVWSLLNDPTTVHLCHKHRAQIQVFDVMNGVLAHARETPHASGYLRMVAHEISNGANPITTSQLVFKWLTQFDIAGLHFDPNLSLNEVPDIGDDYQMIVSHAIEALLSGNDMEEDVHVQVTFHAQDQDMVLFYYPGPTAEYEMMISYIKKGASFEEPTHPNHAFRLYSAVDPHIYYDHVVEGSYGEQQDVHVTLE